MGKVKNNTWLSADGQEQKQGKIGGEQLAKARCLASVKPLKQVKHFVAQPPLWAKSWPSRDSGVIPDRALANSCYSAVENGNVSVACHCKRKNLFSSFPHQNGCLKGFKLNFIGKLTLIGKA